MTCIVGIAKDASVWFGADSRVSGEEHYQVSLIPKVWKPNDAFIIGAAGNSAWFSALRQISWPTVATINWLLTGLPISLRQAGDKLGLSFPSENEESHHDGAAILGCSIGNVGRIFYIDSYLDIDEYTPETAIGSGDGKAARAALFVATGTPLVRIRKVLDAVAHVATDVGPPFITMKL